jgi:hypothetical protein
MKKEEIFNIAITTTPEDLEEEARVFWSRLFGQHQIETVAFGADLEKRFPPPAGVTYHDPSDYRESIINLIRRKKDEEGQPLGYDGVITYEAYVKPHLPSWRKIGQCFNRLKIDEDHFDSIVMKLKPWPFATEFTKGDPKLERLVKSTCDEFKKARQKFGRLAPQLDRIRFPEHDLSLPFGHFRQGQYKDWMSWSEQVVRYGERIPRLHYRYFGIEQGKYRSPQKHSFWTYAVAGAVYYVNCFCHGTVNVRTPRSLGRSRARIRTDCQHTTCKIIHEESYLVVAKLLKVLYPKIWHQDTEKVASNIKTRAERKIRSLQSLQTNPAS